MNADGSGNLIGKFTIPANIPAGAKLVEFAGAAGSVAEAVFMGEGRRVITTRDVTVVRPMVMPIDPLAQTFTLDTSQQIGAVDIWFTAAGPTPVEMQVRETLNGTPTQTVLASVRLAPSQLILNGTHTRIDLPYPLHLQAGTEYAIVLLCTDAIAACSIAELGKLDPTTQQWVTQQPYQVGILLSSSNAISWTPHQDRDLAFRLLAASFSPTTRTIALGNVAVTGATDLVVRANVEAPDAVATCRFAITLPGGAVHYVSADQLLRLDTAVTGNVAVSAILTGSAGFSPILHRDVQLIWGVVSTTADYISREVTAGASVKVRVVVEVNLPGTASISASFKGVGDGAFTALNAPIKDVVMQDGWRELTYESATITKTGVFAKLSLTGTSQYRPQARNLRVVTG